MFHEGTSAERFFLLLDGTIRVVKTTPDVEQVTSIHRPAGQLFGIAQALGRETYPATAVVRDKMLANQIVKMRVAPKRLGNPKTPSDYGMQFSDVDIVTADYIRLPVLYAQVEKDVYTFNEALLHRSRLI